MERVRLAISDEPVELHIPLLDEGTDVWVIAKGQRVGPRTYLIKSFEIDLAAQDAKPAFDVGARVHIDGGDAQWSGNAIAVQRRASLFESPLRASNGNWASVALVPVPVGLRFFFFRISFGVGA